MILIEQLTFRYQTKKTKGPLIHIPELHIREHQKTMLAGRSGCGKTTLLNLITGILQPESGIIHIGGQKISTMSDRTKRLFRLNHIGYVLQEFSLIPHLKLQDNIKLPFYINPAFKWQEQHQDMLQELSQRLQIDHLGKKYPPQLSVGEKQRACLCRALITRPKLILADEPTANLDEQTRNDVLQMLDTYLQTERATLLMVCHDKSMQDWFDTHIAFKDINHV